MENSNKSKWLGPLAGGISLVLLAAILYYRQGMNEKPPVSTQSESDLIEVSEFEVRGIMTEALAQNPSLKKDEAVLRQAIIEEIYQQEMLWREGLSRGMVEKDSMIRGRLVDLMIDSIHQQADTMITEENVREYYEQNKDQYLMPAKRKVIHLVEPVTNKVESDQALAILNDKFSLIENQASDQTGDLKPLWFTLTQLRMRYGPTMAKRIFNMPIGQWSDPVESATGWHRIKVVEEQTTQPKPFEQARTEATENLKKQLHLEVFQRELERLREKYPLQITE